MGDAVAKLGWCLGAILILLMLAAWKKMLQVIPSPLMKQHKQHCAHARDMAGAL